MKGAVYSSRSALYTGLFENGVRRAEKGAECEFTMAAFNVLVQWHGFQPTASGFLPLSIAEFSL